MDLLTFNALKRAARTVENNGENPIRIAILSNHSSQFFRKSIEYQLQIARFSPEIFEADYDQIDLVILDNGSELHRKEFDFIIFLESSQGLSKQYDKQYGTLQKSEFADLIFQNVQFRIQQVQKSNPSATIVLFTFENITDPVFATHSLKEVHSLASQIHRLNHLLISMAQNNEAVQLIDINPLLIGADAIKNYPLYIQADLHYDIDIYALISHHLVQLIKASKGILNKCLILDLDNTTWGGVIGDDGLERIQVGSLGIGKAFTNLQKWAKGLKERGIILAICSKNTEEIAKEPFEKHPEMVLRLDDISVFVANWENKADNIRFIQKVLNVGFDSMVFLDDNPAEREIVRQNLPEVTVPELPSDPVNYLPYLLKLNLFETTVFSEKDGSRTKNYQEEAKRQQEKMSFTNMDDYLKSLHMVAQIGPFEESEIPRVAQLTQRSNQFNLRTQRYSEADIRKIMASDRHLTFKLILADKFGDYGLVSLVILEQDSEDSYSIDTWIMSCRVLKRGVEHFIMQHIVNNLKEKGISILKGEYLPTKKNALVKNLLPDFGMKPLGDQKYEAELRKLAIEPTHITEPHEQQHL